MRVVIGEDQVLLREGLARLLEDEGFEVVAQAGDGEDLVRKVGAHAPDLVITDIRMPPTHTDEGLRAALEIRAERPGTAVLVLSQFVQEQYAVDLLAGDASGVGYLLKQRVGDLDEFFAALNRVVSGGSVVDPDVVSEMLGRARRADPLAELTDRQREVLGMMAEGLSNAAIANRMVITERTVAKHIAGVFAALDLTDTPDDHRRVRAVVTFLSSS